MAKRPDWTKGRKAAEAGDADAQYLLAFKCQEDDDDAGERAWLEKAAAQGHGLAHYRLAELSHDDRAKWLTRGAKLGDAHCQAALGASYMESSGGHTDEGRGVHWLLKAAAQGFYEAEFELYKAYRDGKGVAADPAEALRYLRLAAGRGYVWPMLEWGERLHRGDGMPKDKVEGYMWLLLAMPAEWDRDYPEMRKTYLDPAARRMTKAQIAEATRRKKRWRPKRPSIGTWSKKYDAEA